MELIDMLKLEDLLSSYLDSMGVFEKIIEGKLPIEDTDYVHVDLKNSNIDEIAYFRGGQFGATQAGSFFSYRHHIQKPHHSLGNLLNIV